MAAYNDLRLPAEQRAALVLAELSILRGGGLRRAHLRRHLRVWPGCWEYRDGRDRKP